MQVHADAAQRSLKPSAAAVCPHGYRRLSITKVPVHQPLKFQHLPKNHHVEDITETKRLTGASVTTKSAGRDLDVTRSATLATGNCTCYHDHTSFPLSTAQLHHT